jgi:hypothetical protein
MVATGCKKSEVDKVLAIATDDEELLIRKDLIVTGKDRSVICGKKWYDEFAAKAQAKEAAERQKKAEKEAQQAAEREKLEAERKEQERLDREMEDMNRRIVSLVNKLRGMPKLTEGEAIKWIKDNQDDQLGGFAQCFSFVGHSSIIKP